MGQNSIDHGSKLNDVDNFQVDQRILLRSLLCLVFSKNAHGSKLNGVDKSDGGHFRLGKRSEKCQKPLTTGFMRKVRKPQRQKLNRNMGQNSIVSALSVVVSSAFHGDQIVIGIEISQESTVAQVR
jgi:hypothetical protein